MIRLLLCDRSMERRRTLRGQLALQPEVEIVGEAVDGAEALTLAVTLSPDVILLEVGLPVVDSASATRRLRELAPAARVIALAGPDDEDAVMTMIEAGASDYVVAGAPLWELERAIAEASDPLVRLAQGLARWATRESLAEYVARELVELTGAAGAAAYLAIYGDEITLAGTAGDVDPEVLSRVSELALSALARDGLVRADEAELEDLCPGCGYSEAAAVCLVADSEALGVLLVLMREGSTATGDPGVLHAAAELVAGAVAGERRLAATFAEARSDSLTGLANRRAFDEHLDTEIRIARASRTPVGIAFLDLDDFKQVNDKEGHHAGDQVLREASRVILRNLRAGENAFRVGGEEFAVVIRGDSHAAARVSERIRLAMVHQRRGRRLPSVSAGTASFPTDALTREGLLRKADVALYVAKSSGKNRVAVFQEALERPDARGTWTALPAARESLRAAVQQPRILVVDDDESLRLLVHTTLDGADMEVQEAEDGRAALDAVSAARPDVVVLDVGLPGMDGLTLCRRLRNGEDGEAIGIVLLTGSDEATRLAAEEAGADAFLRKPFSPLELVTLVEDVARGRRGGPIRAGTEKRSEDQVVLYAQDLRQLLELERTQSQLLQQAYRETMTVMAAALESKDSGTGAHSQRVQRYALELVRAIDPSLLEDPTLEYGFVLHDVGKIGIPDRVLLKPSALSAGERRLMQTHTVLGSQMLSGIALLQGEGIKVVRSHHERWDGRGYPDGLVGSETPVAARAFAVADALDAMTSDRPYRRAGTWDAAVKEIVGEAGGQFDPDVVEVFLDRQSALRRVYADLAAA